MTDPTLHQRCLALLSNPDLEWIEERLVSEISSLCGAQSAALWLQNERGGLSLKAYRGLWDLSQLPDRLDPSDLGTDRLSQGEPWDPTAEGRVLWVPLTQGEENIGLVQLADPVAGPFRPELLPQVRALADFGAAAVKNAQRFALLQRVGLKDRETAAYTLPYFSDYASKEIYKARRYGRTFSLLIFSIDNLPQLKSALGANEAKRTVRGLSRSLSRIIRDSDVLAHPSEQEFYLLLPETDFFGAGLFLRRARGTVAEDIELSEIQSRFPIDWVAGAACYPKDGDDFDELVGRCRRRLEEARTSLQRRLQLASLTFWEQVELLVGDAQSPKLPTGDQVQWSHRGKVSEGLFGELQTEIANELLRDPSVRGVVYVGSPEASADLPIAESLADVPADLVPRVYLLGKHRDLDAHPALTPVFLDGDERIGRHQFVLWMSENAAYGLVQRRGVGASWGFHTSDFSVVDGLIAKLQEEYDLQPL